MATVLLIVHVMIAVALVIVVLLQRSEGGALGIGGGGGGGGFMSGRAVGNVLTRVTAVLALAFFATSITLTLLSRQGTTVQSILEGGDDVAVPAAPAPSVPAPEAPAPILSQDDPLSNDGGDIGAPAPTEPAEAPAFSEPVVPRSD